MELRHLRYFTAVVQWNGYRQAAKHLYIAQPSISQAVADLEGELGIKLFLREGRVARLTPEGQIFYAEAVKTLAQAETAIATARRAAKGEIGRLGIGFIGHSTYLFLPALLRKYKALYPGVVLRLEENEPRGQDEAFDRGEIDIGFTRTLPSDRQPSFSTKVILREPLLVAFPRVAQSKGQTHSHRESGERAFRHLSAGEFSGRVRHHHSDLQRPGLLAEHSQRTQCHAVRTLGCRGR